MYPKSILYFIWFSFNYLILLLWLTASAVEKDSERVTVTCLVDGLQVSGLLSKTAKNADVYVKFMER
jgi:hypothetical protein